MIQLKSPRELEKMREAGRHVGEILVELRAAVRPGMSTGEIDALAREKLRERRLGSSFLHYSPGSAPPYPSVICTSVNEEIVHGIPGGRQLEVGDLLKLDFGAIFEGFHGDSAVAFVVGEPPAPGVPAAPGEDIPDVREDVRSCDETRRLREATRASLYAGVEQMRAGNRLGDVSHAVQCAVEQSGFSVVRDFVGHGIGREMHEPPQLPNFGRAGRGPRLRVGMVLAIEPMVNAGSPDVTMRDDGWTAATLDGARSCHFEHTVAITEQGPVVLTAVEGSH